MVRKTPVARMAKIKAMWEEMKQSKAAGAPLDMLTLATKSGIPASTLSSHFKRFEIAEAKGPQPTAKGEEEILAEDTVREKALKHLATESTDIIDTALALGTIIVKKHRPLLEYFEAQGKGPDDIILAIMDWYEQKIATEEAIKKKDLYILLLRHRFRDLAEKIKPTYFAELKAKLVYRYARDIILARTRGVVVSPRRVMTSFQRELDRIEQRLNQQLSVELMG